MKTIAEIRQGLATTVEEITGTRTYAYAPLRPVVPCIIPGSHEGEPTTMDGSQDMTLSLFAAQDQLETKVKQRTAELEAANSALAHLAQTDLRLFGPGFGLDEAAGRLGGLAFAAQPDGA